LQAHADSGPEDASQKKGEDEAALADSHRVANFNSSSKSGAGTSDTAAPACDVGPTHDGKQPITLIRSGDADAYTIAVTHFTPLSRMLHEIMTSVHVCGTVTIVTSASAQDVFHSNTNVRGCLRECYMSMQCRRSL
jgi:hypothetical protein